MSVKTPIARIKNIYNSMRACSVMPSCSVVFDSATPWTVAYQADARLDDQFGALQARAGGHVERSAVGRVVGACHLGQCIRFGMQYVGFAYVVLVFADVLKTGRCTVVAIGDDHLILNEQCTHFAAHAIAFRQKNSYCPFFQQ